MRGSKIVAIAVALIAGCGTHSKPTQPEVDAGTSVYEFIRDATSIPGANFDHTGCKIIRVLVGGNCDLREYACDAGIKLELECL
jgi:hypothetical protein